MAAAKSARQVAKGPWTVPSCAAKDGPGLSFVEIRPGSGSDWFAVNLPKTDYNHPSSALGRAYAFELIDGLRNPDGQLAPLHAGLVFEHLGRWATRCDHVCMHAFLFGFGSVLGEYIQTHNGSR